jgi:hypothetical protein
VILLSKPSNPIEGSLSCHQPRWISAHVGWAVEPLGGAPGRIRAWVSPRTSSTSASNTDLRLRTEAPPGNRLAPRVLCSCPSRLFARDFRDRRSVMERSRSSRWSSPGSATGEDTRRHDPRGGITSATRRMSTLGQPMQRAEVGVARSPCGHIASAPKRMAAIDVLQTHWGPVPRAIACACLRRCALRLRWQAMFPAGRVRGEHSVARGRW